MASIRKRGKSYSVIYDYRDSEGKITAEGEGAAVITVTTDDRGLTAECAVKVTHIHVITHVDAEEPTCTQTGCTEHWACIEGEFPCRKYFSDAEGTEEIEPSSTVVRPLGHNVTDAPQKTREVAPTCTVNGGYDLVYKCARCNDVVNRQHVTVEATGHTWGSWETVTEATETSAGKQKRTCSVCGETEENIVPPAGHVHDLEFVAQVDPECTTQGVAEHYECRNKTACGMWFYDANGEQQVVDKTQLRLPARGHSKERRTEITEVSAGCEEAGGYTETSYCTRCGAVLSVDHVTDEPSGHEWDGGKVTRQATLKKEGQRTFTCTVCQETRTETIPQPVRITQGTARTTNNHPCYPDYLIDPYLHDGEDLSGVLFTRYLKDGERNTLFMNYGSEPETIHAFIATEGGVPEVCDTMTGEVSEAQVIRRQEAGENGQQAGYEIELTLPCNYGILVVSKA